MSDKLRHCLKGERYGKLLVLEKAGVHCFPSGARVSKWRCVCDCGKEVEVIRPSLTSGNTKSCGCRRGEYRKTYGLAGSPLHIAWSNMKQRCTNASLPQWEDYGGRGITYDPRWEKFASFLEDMEEGYSEGLTLERVDNNGNYCKDNCKWVPREQQSRNRRKQKSNLTGISGVSLDVCAKRGGRWRARWRGLDGIEKSKSFSVNKYGDELAFFLACEYRQHQIDLLNLMGAGYTKGHGL